MNPNDRLDALLTAARADAPDTAGAELAFETRLAARLREERSSSWLAWGWRLSPFFAALAIASAVWCHANTDLDADPAAMLEAVQSGSPSALLAWWPEGDR